VVRASWRLLLEVKISAWNTWQGARQVAWVFGQVVAAGSRLRAIGPRRALHGVSWPHVHGPLLGRARARLALAGFRNLAFILLGRKFDPATSPSSLALPTISPAALLGYNPRHLFF